MGRDPLKGSGQMPRFRARSGARSTHGAAVQFHQGLYQGQPQTQPAAAAVERAVGLKECLEDRGKQLRLDSRAGILYHDHCALAIGILGQPDRYAATRVGELGRIVQQVAQNLSQARPIGQHPNRLRG